MAEEKTVPTEQNTDVSNTGRTTQPNAENSNTPVPQRFSIKRLGRWWPKPQSKQSEPSKPFLSPSVRLWIVGIVIGVLARTIVGELFKWVLWAVCLFLVDLLVWHYTPRLWNWLRVSIIFVPAALFMYFAIPAVWQYFKPSFAVLKPISWVLPSARSTEILVTDLVGHESLEDVEVVLQDDDRVAEMKRNPASTPQLLPEAIRKFNFPEMDPGPQIYDKWLFINPFVPTHQRYTVDLSFHGNPRPRFQEDIRVEVPKFAGQLPIENMAYAIRISDLNSNSVVLECRDLAFPVTPEWSEDLATCVSIFNPLPSERNWFSRTKAKVQSWWRAT